MNKSKYMRGFIMGGIVGMAAGVLLLPQMDNSTKRKILNRGANLVQNASHIIPGMGQK